jgi:hypothetical protein
MTKRLKAPELRPTEETLQDKRAASEQLRRRKIIGEKLLKAKLLNDARAYAEALRHGGIDDSSMEWKRAWDYFYDR